jgi:hypothetical protein
MGSPLRRDQSAQKRVSACRAVQVDPKLRRQPIPESPSDSTERGILSEDFPVRMGRPHVFRKVALTSAKVDFGQL